MHLVLLLDNMRLSLIKHVCVFVSCRLFYVQLWVRLPNLATVGYCLPTQAEVEKGRQAGRRGQLQKTDAEMRNKWGMSEEPPMFAGKHAEAIMRGQTTRRACERTF